MICRYWDISLIICFSVMFVGAEKLPDQLPPPKNIKVTWKTPFTLAVTWEKPDDLDDFCTVNYTVKVLLGEDCPANNKLTPIKTPNLYQEFHVSNENGLCIIVITNPDSCGNKTPNQQNTTIPPPQVPLVKNLRCTYYSQNNMTCIWSPGEDVQDLNFYYWLPMNGLVKKCSLYINETKKIRGCEIYNEDLWDTVNSIFFLFNGTFKGTRVSNTFSDKSPRYKVRPNKPKLTITRDGKYLTFQSSNPDFNISDAIKYRFIYRKCNEELSDKVENNRIHTVEYDSACKYKARVQILISESHGKGESEQSDEVEYGENNNPKLPVLLAVIIIPLVVSCCLIVSLVLLKRHKDIILPKIPEPRLIFKDMLNNNIRMTTDDRSSTAGRLYIPIEEIVEDNISVEPQETFLQQGP